MLPTLHQHRGGTASRNAAGVKTYFMVFSQEITLPGHKEFHKRELLPRSLFGPVTAEVQRKILGMGRAGS